MCGSPACCTRQRLLWRHEFLEHPPHFGGAAHPDFASGVRWSTRAQCLALVPVLCVCVCVARSYTLWRLQRARPVALRSSLLHRCSVNHPPADCCPNTRRHTPCAHGAAAAAETSHRKCHQAAAAAQSNCLHARCCCCLPSLLCCRDLHVVEQLALVAALPDAAHQRVDGLRSCGHTQCSSGSRKHVCADETSCTGALAKHTEAAPAALCPREAAHLVGVKGAHEHKRHVQRAALEEQLKCRHNNTQQDTADRAQHARTHVRPRRQQ